MGKKTHPTLLLSALVLMYLLAFSPYSHAYDFPSSQAYPTGSKPAQLSTADFNMDGMPDLAVANSGEKTVSVYLGQAGQPDGRGLVRAADCAAPDFALSVVCADFDGDGTPDMAVGTRYTGIWVMPGGGDGTFKDAVSVSGAMEARHLVVADFNRDGLPDIAAAEYSTGLVHVLTNRGGLAFEESWFMAGENAAPDPNPGPVWLASADFDKDGLPDIAVADHDAGGVAVFKGDGMGGFGLAAYLPGCAGPRTVGAMDIDGDGSPDVAVTCGDSSSVSVFTGAGDGTFGARQDITCLDPEGLVLGDFDGDGSPDMAVTSGRMAAVSVMMGKGGGSFKAADVYHAGAWPQSIISADFGGDGMADLAFVDRDDALLEVLLGYEQTYSLAAAPAPPEGGSVSNTGGVYAAGSVVEIEAAPCQGWSFAGWDGPVEDHTSPGTRVTMTGDLSVQARFVRNGGILSISQDGILVTLTANYFNMGTPVGNGTAVKFYARYSTDGGQTWSKWASKGKAKTYGGVASSKPVKLKKQGAWQFKATYTPRRQLPIPTNSVECASTGIN